MRPSQKRPNLTAAQEHAREVLDFLFRVSGLTDEEAAARTNRFSRQTFNNRRIGFAKIQFGEEPDLARPFGVDPGVFQMTWDELWLYLGASEEGRRLRVRHFVCITAA